MMRKRFRFALVCLLALAPLLHAAPSGEELFFEGNARFAEGDFAEAADLYARALETVSSANLHHNAALSARELGDFGKARLHWERALALEPRHEKARKSLDGMLAELNLADSETGFLGRVGGFFSLAQWIWLAAASGWILVFSVLGFAWKRNRRLFATAGIGAAGAIVAAAVAFSLTGVQRDGIVVAQEADLRVAPVPHSPVARTLRAAERVQITETRGEFVHVRRSDGTEGYLSRTEITPIF